MTGDVHERVNVILERICEMPGEPKPGINQDYIYLYSPIFPGTWQQVVIIFSDFKFDIPGKGEHICNSRRTVRLMSGAYPRNKDRIDNREQHKYTKRRLESTKTKKDSQIPRSYLKSTGINKLEILHKSSDNPSVRIRRKVHQLGDTLLITVFFERSTARRDAITTGGNHGSTVPKRRKVERSHEGKTVRPRVAWQGKSTTTKTESTYKSFEKPRTCRGRTQAWRGVSPDPVSVDQKSGISGVSYA